MTTEHQREWDQWVERNHDRLEQDGTPWERTFVEEVLSQIPGLAPDKVEAQTLFTAQGHRIDFTISEGDDDVRIALEVDGWDKPGRGHGMTQEEFKEWNLRELAIKSAGYELLRFANGSILDRKVFFRQVIESALRSQRERARAMADSEEVARREQAKMAELQVAAQRAQEAVEEEKAGRKEAQQKLRELEVSRRREDRARLSAKERELLLEYEAEMDRLRQEREEAMQKLEEAERKKDDAEQKRKEEEKRRRTTEKDRDGMKVIGIVALIAMVVVVVGFLVIDRNGGGDNTSAEIAYCEESVPVSEVASLELGTQVSVKGRVAGARRITSDPERVHLNLGRDYPDQEFSIVIWGDNVDNWRVSPEAKHDGREVAVTGVLETFDGVPQIEANSPNDIQNCS